MMDLLYLALAGALGTLARYGLGAVTFRWWGDAFPWGTLIINSLGCLLFGLVGGIGHQHQWLTPKARLIILSGFMGAFTTFSTFAYETGRLMEKGRPGAATANVALEVGLGMACLFVGLAAGRRL